VYGPASSRICQRLARQSAGLRHLTACSLLLTFMLTAGIAVMLLERSDNWPPAFARAHPTIANIGPGINQTIEGYVLGAVLRPGVYTMQRGARVKDLVLAVGGLLDNADITRVEMAGLLADGQSVYVPSTRRKSTVAAWRQSEPEHRQRN
jgi:SLBB domain-containing protein